MCIRDRIIAVQLSYAQSFPSIDKKYISVTGSSEVIVVPDQIELEIILQEYNCCLLYTSRCV